MGLSGKLLVFATTLCLALATPLPQDNSAVAPVPPDTIDKYTVQYFIDSRRFAPDLDTCVFYSYKLGETAKRYSSTSSTVTIWDVWPCDWYNIEAKDDQNPLRDIVGNPKTKMQYFENMSSAYAQMCGGYGFVFTQDVNNIPQDGIWGRIEFPLLMRNTDFNFPKAQMETVDAFNDKMTAMKGLFARSSAVGPTVLPEPSEGPFNFTTRDSGMIVARTPPHGLPDLQCVQPEDIDTKYGFMEAPPTTSA